MTELVHGEEQQQTDTEQQAVIDERTGALERIDECPVRPLSSGDDRRCECRYKKEEVQPVPVAFRNLGQRGFVTDISDLFDVAKFRDVLREDES